MLQRLGKLYSGLAGAINRNPLAHIDAGMTVMQKGARHQPRGADHNKADDPEINPYGTRHNFALAHEHPRGDNDQQTAAHASRDADNRAAFKKPKNGVI